MCRLIMTASFFLTVVNRDVIWSSLYCCVLYASIFSVFVLCSPANPRAFHWFSLPSQRRHGWRATQVSVCVCLGGMKSLCYNRNKKIECLAFPCFGRSIPILVKLCIERESEREEGLCSVFVRRPLLSGRLDSAAACQRMWSQIFIKDLLCFVCVV